MDYFNKLAYFQDAYSTLQKTFRQFADLLVQDKEMQINFEIENDKTIKFELFGFPVICLFSILTNPENNEVFGKIEFMRTFLKDEEDVFHKLYFDKHGNNRYEIAGKHNSFSMIRDRGVNYVVAIMVDKFINVYLTENN